MTDRTGRQVAVTVVMMALLVAPAAGELPDQLPDPDSKPPQADRPVKVYILSGQSNMVGIGQIGDGGTRWKDITDATVSVYPGEYSPDVDYDKLKPAKTRKLPAYGGVRPTPFPGVASRSRGASSKSKHPASTDSVEPVRRPDISPR